MRSISVEPEGTAGNLSSSASNTNLLVADLGVIVSVSKHQVFESFQERKGRPRILLSEDGYIGVSTSKQSGAVRSSVAIGRLLTIASTSIMRVLRDSSFNWLAWF